MSYPLNTHPTRQLQNCPSGRGHQAGACLSAQTLSTTILPEKLPNGLPLRLAPDDSLAAV